VLFFGALALCLDGCGAVVSPSTIECKINALEHLIDEVDGDPMRVTPYDGAELVRRVNECRAAADAGAP
jgi:hypothetical protein